MQAKNIAIVGAALVALTVTGSARAEGEAVGTSAGSEDEAYPQRVIERPLTLPDSMVEASLVYGYHHVDFGDDTEALQEFGLGATVGIGDEFSVTAIVAGMGGGDIDFTKSGALVADKLVYSGAVAETVLRTALPLAFEDADDLVQGLRLGLPTRVIPMQLPVAVFVGDDLFAIRSDGIVVPVNLGIGVQIIDPLWVRLDSTLATLAVSGEENDASLDTLADIQNAQLRLSFSIGNRIDIAAVGRLEMGDGVNDDIGGGAVIAGRM